MAVIKKRPYFQWEHVGMYLVPSEIKDWDRQRSLCLNMFMDGSVFCDAGMEMIKRYKRSCEVFLNNPHLNRIAFIGQATSFYHSGCPEIITKEVFNSLSTMDKERNNDIAKYILYVYKSRSKKIYGQMEIEWICGYSGGGPGKADTAIIGSKLQGGVHKNTQ